MPEFGMSIAIDSTPVNSYSNPYKKSDPEAAFIVKEGLPNKVWKWGFKLHLLVDTASELPIACEISLAKESDVASLIPLINKAKATFSWFKPWYIIADKGYDAGYNYKAIHDIGAIPIIKIKNDSQGQENRFTLDQNGIPHCRSGLQLLLKQHHHEKGLYYVCPFRAGKVDCPLSRECKMKVAWIRPFQEYRKFCTIPRDSYEWNGLYSKRTSVERVNSKLKEHRRLNSHCHRGLAKVRLHSLMSVLSLTVTALSEIYANHFDRIRACTRKID